MFGIFHEETKTKTVREEAVMPPPHLSFSVSDSKDYEYKIGDRVIIDCADWGYSAKSLVHPLKRKQVATIEKIGKNDYFKLKGKTDFVNKKFFRLYSLAKEESLTVTNTVFKPVGEKCPECGSPLVVKRNRFTDRLFVGCSSFPKCKHTMSVALDTASGRGTRGVSELCNGVTVYYAEDWKSLKHYRGMKNNDVGIIRKEKCKEAQHLIYYDGEWVYIDITDDGLGIVADDHFCNPCDDDEEDEDFDDEDDEE